MSYLTEMLRKSAEAEKAKALLTLDLLENSPAGIGEHSDVTEAVIAELNKLAEADDRLEMLDKYFPQ